MKMRNLLLGVILGLLAVVHSTPPNIVTQDDVYREAVTDGYLIDHPFLNSFTTESPKRNKRNTIIQESQQPSTESKVSDTIEGSGDANDNVLTSILLQHGGKPHATTTQSVSHAQTFHQPSSESQVSDVIEGSGDPNDTFMTPIFLQHGDEHYATTTQSVSHAPSSPSEAPALLLPQYIDGSISEDLGSGDEEIIHEFPDTLSSTTSISHTPITSSTSKADVSRDLAPKPIKGSEVSVSESVSDVQAGRISVPKPQIENTVTTGQSTPGWIIIVAFIVGVAALVVLCVAIATRDKWNGPKQTSHSETNSSNQQRELEMETFLHKDQPTENGHNAEYTVIPLDELPERYASH